MLSLENKYLFKLAWRSILRKKGRSFFIIFSVVISVCIAIWVIAFFEGLNAQIEKVVVDTNVGYHQIIEQNYAKNSEPNNPSKLNQDTLSQIEQVGFYKLSPEFILDAYTSSPEGTQALEFIGVDFNKHKTLMKLDENMTQGQWPSMQTEQGVLIGQELALKFQLNVGDMLNVNYQNVSQEIKNDLMPIIGIYHKNGRSFEKTKVYLSAQRAYELFFGEMNNDFYFHRIVSFEKTMKENFKLAESYKLKSWKDLNPEMGVILEFHDGMINLFLLIIAITVTMTILTPVNILWQERLSELKMMTIIGIPQRKIWKIGFFESIFMICISTVVAIIVLSIIISIQKETGLDFSKLNEGKMVERAGIELPSIIYPLLKPSQFFMTFGFVFIVFFISYSYGIFSTIRKLRTDS
jgi:ABC-type lipoprotein release transport system permease subunit